MGFIKHADGKIMSVIEEEELTPDQKKSAQDLSKRPPTTNEEASVSTMTQEHGAN